MSSGDAQSAPLAAPLSTGLTQRRRWIWRSIGCLCAGLLFALGSAWAAAALHEHDAETDSYAIHEQHGHVHAVGFVRIRRGCTVLSMLLTDGFAIDQIVEVNRAAARSRHARGGASAGTGTLPYWSSAHGPARAKQGWEMEGYLDWAYGWPMRALKHSHITRPIGVWEASGNSASSGDTRGALEISPRITLPYLPIWPGILANTAFYAVIIAAIHLGALAIRRRRRLRRGLCPVCRYDLRGLDAARPCPECGTARRASAAAATGGT